MRLLNKVVIITGAASGIGLASVEKCLAEGARVIAADVNAGKLSRLDSLDPNLQTKVCDITQQEDIDNLVAHALDSLGLIDAIVNSAGISNREFAADAPLAEVWQKVMDTNMKGTMLVCDAALPHMRERRCGSIVNLGSVMSTVVHHHEYGLSNGFNPYQQSKGAVLQFTRDFAVQQAEYNIRANCVCPGFVTTALTSPLTSKPDLHHKIAAQHPMRRFGEPAEVANAVAFLASDEASFITGTAMYVDGGYTAV